MSVAAHRTVIVVTGLLLVLMGFLLLHGPRFTVGGETVRSADDSREVNVPDTDVTCGSILTVGWPSDHAWLDTLQGGSTSTHSDLPSMDADNFNLITAGFDQECNERRDTYQGFLTVLAVPTTILAMLAIVRRPRRTSVAAADVDEEISQR
jgi:hypothetical protein